MEHPRPRARRAAAAALLAVLAGAAARAGATPAPPERPEPPPPETALERARLEQRLVEAERTVAWLGELWEVRLRAERAGP